MTREIDIETATRMRVAGAPVVDVRAESEFLQARVPGARCIPLDQLAARLDEIDEAARVRDLRGRQPLADRPRTAVVTARAVKGACRC